MRNIDVTPRPLAELASHLSDAATKRLDAVVDAGRRLGQGRTIFNITPSAAADSGVAEAVETITALALDAGIDTRWYQLDMPAPFRVLSERLDNWLHGYDGDGGSLRDKERDLYEHVLSSNAENLVDEISNGDIVVLHEAATAGLAQAFSEAGAWVVWRCHGGTEDLNEHSQLAWSFLEPYLDWANRMVFTRDVYRPPFAPPDSCDVIAPSIVPDSPKNRVLDLDESLSIVRLAGIFDGVAPFDAVPFIREDGRPGVIERLDGVMLAGGPVPQGARVVTQVSRWSALKGNVQLIEAFAADRELLADDVHLLLVGPALDSKSRQTTRVVNSASGEPQLAPHNGHPSEAARVLAQVLDAHAVLPPSLAERVHVAAIPMLDREVNALIVNALQRTSTVITLMSRQEGFGLPVTEAMWKKAVVVAAQVGGLIEQIDDGVNGVLVPGLPAYSWGQAVAEVLRFPQQSAEMGLAAHESVRANYLPDRHLRDWLELIATMVDER